MNLPKRILLGISGGIAAYKAAELSRLLVKRGVQVRVVMTDNAQKFIQQLTLQALTQHPVYTDTFADGTDHAMAHIDLAKWAEAIVIAPATANVMAKLASGSADDLLTTLCLATTAPLILAPAMNQQMWRHPATQANRAILSSRGVSFLGPDSGVQACGDVGAGRMLAPEAIVAQLTQTQELADKTVVITAGPTVEAIDPVRYLSNRSSGKMGYALAQQAQQMGATVVLISGPTALDCPAGVTRIDVHSAEDMYQAVMAHHQQADIIIAAAAVADFTIAEPCAHKLKKHTNETQRQLNLVRTKDILYEVTQVNTRAFIVGFAAETQDILKNAVAKLAKKQCHLLIANQVGYDQTFGKDSASAIALLQSGEQVALAHTSKQQLARQILQIISSKL